ncbi:MAG TPA: hypothetical protein VKU00_31715 [Chthonomonadaceae bacterium]|nr:hypothetical protein [Chthonomonadaceae bacterium]
MDIRFIVGLSDSKRSQLWRAELTNIDSIHTFQYNDSTEAFYKKANIDIEMMATSLVATRFSLFAPINMAGVYLLLCSECAPLIVVPPILKIDMLQENHRYDPNKSSHYNIVYYQWWQMFERTIVMLNNINNLTIRVGLHCDTIGFFKHSDEEEQELVDAFRHAYTEFARQIGHKPSE